MADINKQKLFNNIFSFFVGVCVVIVYYYFFYDNMIIVNSEEVQ